LRQKLIGLVVGLVYCACAATTPVFADPPTTKPDTVYVVLCVDTETRRLSSYQRTQCLDLSDFSAGAPVDSAISDEFRNSFTDSFGGHPRFSWFLLTHEAYFFADPPQPLAVFEAMAPYVDRLSSLGDIIGWHYHHSLWPKADSACCWDQLTTFNGTRYGEMTDIEVADQMLAMLILRQRFYPTVFRAGWVWENNEFSKWLDDVIPFDFSNAAPLKTRTADSVEQYVGAGYDWSQAPDNWTYCDSNYQKPGNLKRIVFRCFPGHRGADLNFIKAFVRAKDGHNAIVAAYTHSFNNLGKFCRVTASSLRNAATVYPNVTTKYVNALEGAQAVLGYSDKTPPVLTLERRRNLLIVSSSEPLFAPPVGAYTDTNGKLRRVYPVERQGTRGKNRLWEWRFDAAGLVFTEFAAGACDSSGNGAVTEILRP
jgi:hypothetical protein